MEKQATTVEEQIQKLESRGMTFTDKEKARECLLDIGYFRLGFYWFPFEKTYPRKVKRTHEFKEGTTFDQALQLYYFDCDLRSILLKYINRVEINFRTQLIYRASNHYKDDPFWYVNPKRINGSFLHGDDMTRALRYASHEEVISHDLKTHKRKVAPAWKTMEFFSFGNVVMLYDNMKENPLKCVISNQYGISSPNTFFGYIDAVRKLRNFCAHGSVLYDKHLPQAIGNGPLGNLGNSKARIFGAYRVLEYLLGMVSANRLQDMKAEIKAVFDGITDDTVKSIILQNSGFMLNLL